MSTEWIFRLFYLAFVVGTFIIRWPHHKRNKRNQIIQDQKTGLEKGLLFGASLGMMFLPLLYVFTSLLGFADYSLPVWARMLGVLIMLSSLWLFYRSHNDLGRNWSPTLEVRQDHTLITAGIYKSIRHPMYTSIWLWVIAQPLLLLNYVAGLSGVVAFGLLYFLRIGKEEQMMIRQFGQQYKDYITQTNRLIPKL